ncbi:MAG: DNA-3-methyladenine glycosylase [Candidatus Paceibacterota bacterium]
MSKPLSLRWFRRPVLEVAPELLGRHLVVSRKGGRGSERFVITEVEAYDGPEDLACHASRGRTTRTEVMYQAGGVFYVYLVYGMHWMLNIVTGAEGYPAAVLIRGVEGISGPGKLTRRLGIDHSLNARSATGKGGVWFEESGLVVPENTIEKTPRVGVDYAGEWARRPYRFVLRP